MLQHSKKMLLVDPERQPGLLASLQSHQQQQPPLQQHILMPQQPLRITDMDREISETLNKQMPEDIKAKLYHSILGKYMSHKQLSTDVVRKSPRLDEEEILESLPPNVRYKGRRLLSHIRNNPDVEWNDKGELIYHQSVIKKSNIIDLIGELLKSNSSKTEPLLSGWEEFTSILRASDIPKYLIVNSRRWKDIQTTRTPRSRVRSTDGQRRGVRVRSQSPHRVQPLRDWLNI